MPPQHRVGMLYEAQIARALNEGYEDWFMNKQKREEICVELIGATSTSTAPALMDTQ